MAIARPVTKTKISTVDFGIPVVDFVNAWTPTAWALLTLQNGWTAFGAQYASPQYRKVGDMVQLIGAIKNAAAVTSPGQSQIGVLPTGYRPPLNMITTVIFGGSDGWGGMGRLDINSTGGVLVTVSAGMTGAHTITAFNVAFATV